MPDPAAERGAARTPRLLAGMAGLACLACCLLPALIAAGVVGGSAGVLVGWLPATAIALAVLAVGAWWLGLRRPTACSCSTSRSSGSCRCEPSVEPAQESRR
jgi:mercuric ion transport protein